MTSVSSTSSSTSRCEEESGEQAIAPITHEAPAGPTTDDAPAVPVTDGAAVPPLEPDSVDEELDLELDPDSAEIEAAGPITDDAPAPAAPVGPGSGEYVEDDDEEDELEDEDEDLLDKTPDFLQDTPEGDRLWFEQSGPKDFDFDDDDEKK